jgi:hypothetical protein
MAPEAPHPDRSPLGSPSVAARVTVTLAGLGGFLGLLITGAEVRSGQDALRVAALIWFLGFGILRVILDLRASGGSRGRDASGGRDHRRTAAGLR